MLIIQIRIGIAGDISRHETWVQYFPGLKQYDNKQVNFGVPRGAEWITSLLSHWSRQDLARSNTQNGSTSSSIYGGLTLRATEINTVAAWSAYRNIT
jgi:hypothetical protein